MDYKTLLKKIEIYKTKYNVKVIGKSLFQRNIFAVERIICPAFSTAFLVGSVHARENITTDLLCQMLDDNLFDEITDFNVALVLMANPDGVELAINGLDSVPEIFREKLLQINNQNPDFSLWKANGRGVDINNNFNALFGKHKNSDCFASQGYSGENFESEPETQALVSFTKSKNMFLTVSYHSKGEEIYFEFFQTGKRLARDRLIAERFANSTGYKIKNVQNSSSGGYKDWCVQKLKIPALTIEVGSDSLSHPIAKEFLPEIVKHHKGVAKDLCFAYNVFEGKDYGI